MIWSCPRCGNSSDDGKLACPSCGWERQAQFFASRKRGEQPSICGTRAFIPFVIWTGLTALGVAGVFLPSFRSLLGFPFWLLLIEVVLAGWAGVSSLVSAFWERWFRKIDIAIPATVQALETFEVTLHLEPYQTLRNVTLKVELVDRFFVRDAAGGYTASSRCRGRHLLVNKSEIPGGRPSVFGVRFKAPFPFTEHENLASEIVASVLSFVGWLVPGASHLAQNLREHGGYFVRVLVQVGFISRRYEKRVVFFYVGAEVHVG